MMLQALLGGTTVPPGYLLAAIGTMTKDSASAGTTTVTTVRGGTTGGGTFSALGTYVQNISTAVFGLRATASSGAITNARRTFIDTDGLQISGAASLLATIDNLNWYEFEWKLDVEPTSWGTNYTWANADGLSGDPFGLYAMADDTVVQVRVAIAA